MPEREIYLLSPRALSPETIAVAFAKTSRSPESFRAIAAVRDVEMEFPQCQFRPTGVPHWAPPHCY